MSETKLILVLVIASLRVATRQNTKRELTACEGASVPFLFCIAGLSKYLPTKLHEEGTKKDKTGLTGLIPDPVHPEKNLVHPVEGLRVFFVCLCGREMLSVSAA
ncbi:MAG: hypothetical protein KA368_01080 [Acidobacteria bacterium]|nr:hypothetical protein [Acidobacteriota bacterium]